MDARWKEEPAAKPEPEQNIIEAQALMKPNSFIGAKGEVHITQSTKSLANYSRWLMKSLAAE